MKIRFIIFLIIIVISLSACADASISYKLSDDNSLNISYSLSVSSTEEDISGNISLIKEYWTNMGFSVDDSEHEGVFTLDGEKTIDCQSKGIAVKELSSILTAKDSLFYDAKLTYSPSYFEDLYDLSANIILRDIVRQSEEINIPAAEIKSFLSGAENGTYRLSIALPGDIQETNADEQDGQVCTWLLRYGEARELKLKTKRVFEENVSHYAKLNEIQSRDNLLLIISCAAAGALLLIIIIIAAVRRAARPKRSEFYVERF